MVLMKVLFLSVGQIVDRRGVLERKSLFMYIEIEIYNEKRNINMKVELERNWIGTECATLVSFW